MCCYWIVSWVGYSFWAAYQPRPELLQGQIEAEQYNISSKVPGRIENIFVKKGEMIEKGQAVFSLYSPEIEAKLAQAKAGEAAASALAEEAEQGARSQQIAASKDQWKKAKAASQLLEKTYARVNNLYHDGVVAEQKRMKPLRSGKQLNIQKVLLSKCIKWQKKEPVLKLNVLLMKK